MANVWHDKRTFVDENKFISAKLQQTHQRVHSVKKKQVFGELKNVMHNQIGVTPLKGGWEAKNKGNKCNDGGVSNKKACVPNDAENNKHTIDPVELFDLFDFPKSCCTTNCTKSVEEIWANHNQIDEIALLKAMEKIRNGGRIVDFDDDDGSSRDTVDEVHDESEEESLDDSLTKSVKHHLYLEDYGNEDFSSCSAEMPKFDIFNDLPLLNVK